MMTIRMKKKDLRSNFPYRGQLDEAEMEQVPVPSQNLLRLEMCDRS